ncbi:hypothetical protein [Tistrella mobilis]|uniref:hypothetical protein n=1 Tax=Tistrella mobilis TaxID=171437 RepID=UPI003555D697
MAPNAVPAVDFCRVHLPSALKYDRPRTMQQNHPVSDAEKPDTTAMPRTVWRRPQLTIDDLPSSTLVAPASTDDGGVFVS